MQRVLVLILCLAFVATIMWLPSTSVLRNLLIGLYGFGYGSWILLKGQVSGHDFRMRRQTTSGSRAYAVGWVFVALGAFMFWDCYHRWH